ncbi:MAG TPA: hypothetical protein VF263_18130 [Longimicrobiaceae bacterium]
MRRHAAVFLASGALAAAAFWRLAGRSLGYDVYMGDVYSHSEPYSQSGRLIITAVVALAVAVPTTWLAHVIVRRSTRT